MKFKSVMIAAASLCVVALYSASASDRLSSAELNNLESICGDLLGKPFLSPTWDKLQPYLRDKKALKGAQVVCSGSCGGSFALRGGLSLRFIYVNPQKMGGWGPKDALIYSVTLADSGNDIFHREIEPKAN